jgi:uncharacterized membrane protein
MKRIKSLLAILVVSVVFTACYYDKAELVYPQDGGNTCDTTNMKYVANVVPILSNNCYACHSGTAAAGAGIKLDTYTNLRPWATNGVLLNAISHTGGASPMPKGGSKLSDCNINTIRAWINRGALNN